MENFNEGLPTGQYLDDDDTVNEISFLALSLYFLCSVILHRLLQLPKLAAYQAFNSFQKSMISIGLNNVKTLNIDLRVSSSLSTLTFSKVPERRCNFSFFI